MPCAPWSRRTFPDGGGAPDATGSGWQWSATTARGKRRNDKVRYTTARELDNVGMLVVVPEHRENPIMRDDLHRGAPVARHWKRVVQCCAEGAADLDGAIAIERAARHDANALIGDDLLDRLRPIASGVELPYVDRNLNLGRPLREAERVVLRAFHADPSRGLGAAIRAGLEVACRDTLNAVRAHVLAVEPRSANEMMRRMTKVVGDGAFFDRVSTERAAGVCRVPRSSRVQNLNNMDIGVQL